MSETAFSFSAERSSFESGAPAVSLKIRGPSYEINVWLEPSELPRLQKVLSTPWSSGALHIGVSAGAKAFWSSDSEEVSVNIGHDDQAWDIGISFPTRKFSALLAELDQGLSPVS